MNIENYNLRQMQAYSALCLWKFCFSMQINNENLNKLIMHLLTILTTNNLLEWERLGGELSVTGRGDPLPQELVKNIHDNIKVDLMKLIDSCVEVGIVDMFGEESEQPLFFLNECKKILDKYALESPPLSILNTYKVGKSRWGEPITDAELKQIINKFCNWLNQNNKNKRDSSTLCQRGQSRTAIKYR